MSSPTARKPLRTYSRQRHASLHAGEPPAKRRRVEASRDGLDRTATADISSPLPVPSSSPTRDALAIPTSSPKTSQPVFSDTAPTSTPPSSSPPPQQPQPSPPQPRRRPIFSFLKRKSESHALEKAPLSERSHNVTTPPKQPPKKKQLVQMQLDLVGELRKTCKTCGMEYIPSNAEDAALHRKFHAMNVGGVDFTKAFVEKAKQNQVWAGGDGSLIAVIARKDTWAFRHKASEVLKVVNTELAAVTIPDGALWSQIDMPLSRHTQAERGHGSTSTTGNRACATSDRFKVYLYIRGQKCVGACLAERIQEAYTVLDGDDASAGRVPAQLESSSISVSEKSEPAILGISRIWTSSLHRKHGIATRLLDSARSDFLYGMTVDKSKVAFSQPTESGGQLARKWFGRQAGWLLYTD